MNFGTKIRAALTVVAVIITTIYVIRHLSIITVLGGLLIIVTELTNHWYNNDYTEEHCLATGRARQLRKENTVDYIGERFSEEGDE